MTVITEVAAAVLLRGDPAAPQFLLAQRPPGKPYAGYWEFPGGKVEAGETAYCALQRELQEELGIGVEQAWPWVCCEFTYPHATVRLRFFRVNAWRGEPTAIEHSALVWLRAGQTASVAPILPANGPILRALALPAVYALTNASENGVEAELERIGTALRNGLRLIQVRDKTLPADDRRDFACRVMQLAATHPAARVLVNDDLQLATAIAAHGIHLSSAHLRQRAKRPPLPLVAASCHDAEDLAQAAHLQLDFAVLGPVLPTPSHPQAAGMGWQRFADLSRRSPLPLYALGGLQPGLLAEACRHGAHGIAMLRRWP
ncbi:MAG TPA: Nudix family hydrolase [Candidatus Accumulibacter phosphatis]|nr:MAG: Thiamine-phosphate synthase [Candidatus Accumulibacter sp. SK-11]HAY29599.1 Nudix family hydrolase [Accumulibacter sp.]HRL74837.1 Nudix family hydrolase [Candidatus Accumulibacter phosphatis]HCN68630.1 Nudix family hydrolase [Accumulibacter sp.]HCV12340.1 Nudix family hydrolase [Accumulibacter sp.]